MQGCGNTMLDLSDLVPFHPGQVKQILFTCRGTSLNKVNAIQYFILINYYQHTMPC